MPHRSGLRVTASSRWPSSSANGGVRPGLALYAEMRAALDANMQDLLELRQLVSDASASGGAGFQAEASERHRTEPVPR
jgi:hypothetical protein